MNKHENSHKLWDETGHPVVNLMESQWKLKKKHDQHFPMEKSHFRTNTSVRRKKEIQKSSTVRITVWDPRRKVNHLSKIIGDRKNIAEFSRSISSTRIGKPALMKDVKVSKGKNINKWVERENLIYVRWSRIKNNAQRWKSWSIEEKEVRHRVKYHLGSYKNILHFQISSRRENR